MFFSTYVGNVISFVYNAGSKPGSERRVFVHCFDSENETLKTWDFDKRDFRNFNVDYINGVSIPDGANTIKVSSEYSEEIMEALENDGNDCFYDSDRGIVAVVKKKPEPVYVITGRGQYDSVRLRFSNTGVDDFLEFSIGCEDDVVSIKVGGIETTVPQFSLALSDFVDRCEKRE